MLLYLCFAYLCLYILRHAYTVCLHTRHTLFCMLCSCDWDMCRQSSVFVYICQKEKGVANWCVACMLEHACNTPVVLREETAYLCCETEDRCYDRGK